MLLAIAWRNLGRNRRRTLIAGAGIALGVGMCIASFGVMDGMGSDMVRSMTDVQLGHVQVHEPGFSSRPKLELAFGDAEALTRAAGETPGVEAVSPRVTSWALADSGKKSAGVQLVGVEPEREARLTRLDRRVSKGRYLPAAATPWPKARALTAADEKLDQQLTEAEEAAAEREIDGLGDAPDVSDVKERTQTLVVRVAPKPSTPPPLLLGDKLAKKLGVEPGSRLRLMTRDTGGDPVNVEFRVVGIVHTGDSALDAIRAVANLADVQRMLRLPDRAHELAIRLSDPKRAPEVAQALEARNEFHSLDVKTWKQLRPDVVAMVQTNSTLTALMVAIIFAVAAIGVADTIMMAVFERRRELGVLKAVGMRPASLVALITIETFLLALCASAVGVAVGVGLDLYLLRVGIPLTRLSDFSLAGASIPPVIHATLTPEGVVLPFAMMLVAALLAAVWPALAAARVEPVIAMQDR
ncbi:MAG: ABC transporter permease [Myxococcales bacterium]|nr:ABC transporter permease [Myxococcales bacterium]MCB9579892.1 ABC transporter permease [Polyangiaceae bacterium]